MLKKIKFLIVIAIIFGFVWFLVISPMITFRGYESKMEAAAKKYFELNSSQLPTGERIKTVSLKTLYHKSFMENDMYIPYSTQTCSIENSWVKVKKVNNDYKYYVYLECGVLTSTIDHKGPEIKLNGDSSITVGVGEEYKELGVKSVVDNSDGKLNVSDVTIKGSVDTSTVGTYEIQYIAFDSLSNKTTVTREVNVVKTLYSTVKKDLGTTNNYTGNPTNNYIRLSNMNFRIFGYDKNNNIIVVADQDIANVSYSKLDDWLNDYYYEHLNDATKKMIVEAKYCNMTVNDSNLNSTSCNTYTKKKKLSVPSIIEVNKASDGTNNFMKTSTMSWVSNSKGANEAYVTRNVFYGSYAGQSFLPYSTSYNYGVRPMFTISGDSLITGGSGTSTDPYVFNDSKTAKGGDELNTRYTGEYIKDGDTLWRIIDVMSDGTTKVISVDTLYSTTGESIDHAYTPNDKGTLSYNPTSRKSVAYFINNGATKYVDISNLSNHEIEVPIYKNNIIYGTEVSTKKYKVKLSAPNMFEMFSAQTNNLLGHSSGSYWYLNTSKTSNVCGAVTDIGVPVNGTIDDYYKFGIRVVGYFKKSILISSGKGTAESPYIIK
jgi:hypothetical protein